MTGALLSNIGLIIQGLVLGIGGVLVWRSLKGWLRYLSLLLAFAYYMFLAFFPSQSIRVALGHQKPSPYATTDALRYLVLIVAVMATVVLLGLALARERRRRIEAERRMTAVLIEAAELRGQVAALKGAA